MCRRSGSGEKRNDEDPDISKLIQKYNKHPTPELIFKEFSNLHYDKDNSSSPSREIKITELTKDDFKMRLELLNSNDSLESDNEGASVIKTGDSLRKNVKNKNSSVLNEAKVENRKKEQGIATKTNVAKIILSPKNIKK